MAFAVTAVLLAALVLHGRVTESNDSHRVAVTTQLITAADEDLLYLAEQHLTRTCMEAHGFRYWLVPRLIGPDYREFPYVVDDAAWARRHGYGGDLERAYETTSRTSPGARYFRSLPPARQQAFGAALNGPAPDGLAVDSPLGGTLTHSNRGCTATAWRQLYGNAQAWFAASQTVTNLRAVRVEMVVRSPQFTAGVAAWSRCMRGRGYATPSPAELRGRQFTTRRGVSRQEILAATAEAECATRSGLASLARRLDRVAAEAVRGQHQAAFDALRTMQRAALPTARAIVTATRTSS